MAISDDFLTRYKRWETLLRDNGSDVRELEAACETAEPQRCSRIRIMRQFRNYLTHEHDPGFLLPTDKMLDFLEAEIRVLEDKDDIARQHLRGSKNRLFDETTTCEAALQAMAATKDVIIVRANKDKSFSLLHISAILSTYMLNKKAKLAAVKPLVKKPLCAKPSDRILDLDQERVYICTDTGKIGGEVLGVVKF